MFRIRFSLLYHTHFGDVKFLRCRTRPRGHAKNEAAFWEYPQLVVYAKICYTSTVVRKIIQVHISRGDKYFVAECIDFPVVTQGKTLDELTSNLKEAIALQLEGENLSDFGFADEPSVLASFEIEPASYAKA